MRGVLRANAAHLALCPAVAVAVLLFLSPASVSQPFQSIGTQPPKIELGSRLNPTIVGAGQYSENIACHFPISFF